MTTRSANASMSAVIAIRVECFRIGVPPKIPQPRIPRSSVSIPSYPLVVAAAWIAEWWFVDVFIPIHFTTPRSTAQTTCRTTVQRPNRSPEMGDTIDATGVVSFADRLLTILRAQIRLAMAERPLIIDVDAAATDLQSECSQDAQSPAQRRSHNSPRNVQFTKAVRSSTESCKGVIGPHNRYNQKILPNLNPVRLLAMTSCLPLLFESRIVAIIRLSRLERASELVRTLLDAGIRCIEFTLTNPDTPSWVGRLRDEEPRFRSGEACVGLGSVRNVGEAELAIGAGAQFLVTPIASRPIVDASRNAGVPIIAGAYSPTEIASMWESGADLVKVFPVRTLGPGYIRDVLAPMPYLKLVPTGGIDASNARDYLDAGATAIGVGGSMCRADWVDACRWDLIHQAASQLVQSVAV